MFLIGKLSDDPHSEAVNYNISNTYWFKFTTEKYICFYQNELIFNFLFIFFSNYFNASCNFSKKVTISYFSIPITIATVKYGKNG